VPLSAQVVTRADDQSGVAVFTGLVMGGFSLYKLYFPSDDAPPKSPPAKPSPEVLLLMMMFSSTLPVAFCGYLVSHHPAALTILISGRANAPSRLHSSRKGQYHNPTDLDFVNEIRQTPIIPQAFLQSKHGYPRYDLGQLRDSPSVLAERYLEGYCVCFIYELFTCYDRRGQDDNGRVKRGSLGRLHGLYRSVSIER